MFKGMVPPGRFHATCVRGGPPEPNRVLQGQQKQNHAQEKKEIIYHIYIYMGNTRIPPPPPLPPLLGASSMGSKDIPPYFEVGELKKTCFRSELDGY